MALNYRLWFDIDNYVQLAVIDELDVSMDWADKRGMRYVSLPPLPVCIRSYNNGKPPIWL
jgi:hypothetical protein